MHLAVNETVALQAWGLEFDSQNLHLKKLGVVVCTCKSNTEELGTEWVFGACWLGSPDKLVCSRPEKDPVQKIRGLAYEEQHWGLTLSPYMHVHTYVLSQT